MSVEQLVRPFQSPQPFGTRRLIATSIKAPAQTVHLVWGSAGTLPSPQASEPKGPATGVAFNTKKRKETNVEQTREIEKVKVVQEDNEDNFVVIERIKKIEFSEKKAPNLLAQKEGGGAGGSTTTGVQSPTNPIAPGFEGGVPGVISGEYAWVRKGSFPDGTEYISNGKRVYELINTPGPNEQPL
jgi:hypothetical protein